MMTITLQLPDSKEEALKWMAQAEGVSPEHYAEQVITRHLEEQVTSPEAPGSHRHISEVIRERMRTVPPEMWSSLPTDGASEHDHYIYGTPKRNP